MQTVLPKNLDVRATIVHDMSMEVLTSLPSIQYRKWRCNQCYEIFQENKFLIAKNPFLDDDSILGCPNCKSVNDFEAICDEQGCSKVVCCVSPTRQGYRRTCHEHGSTDEPA